MATRRDEIDSLVVEVKKMKEDISDFITGISYTSTPARDVISELRKHRTAYRSKFYRLRLYLGGKVCDELTLDFETLIEKIRSEILNANSICADEAKIMVEATQLQPIEIKATKNLEEEVTTTSCKIESTDHTFRKSNSRSLMNVRFLRRNESLVRNICILL